jgi:hypothetical protein
MPQHEHDEDIERYLRKFQLRAIGPLEMPRGVRSRQLRWLAAVAVVVFAACFVLWYGDHQRSSPEPRTTSEVRSSGFLPPTRINTLALTKLALDDSKAFDVVLADESRAMFPNMQGEQSALRVLAKE